MNINIPLNISEEEEVDFADTLLYYEFVLLAVFMTIVCFLAIAGNLLVMLSFILDKKLRTLNNYFLLSLAASDIMIATFSMPLFTAYLLIGEWPFGPILCDMWLAQDYMCSNASGLNLLMIGFDRYFSVTSPLRYRARRTGRHVAAMISCVWIVSFLVWTPWIYSWQYIEGQRTVPGDECYVQFVQNNFYLAILTAVIAYYIPAFILCVLYYKIWRETVKRNRYLTNKEADDGIKSDLQKNYPHFINMKFRYSKLFSCCSWASKKPYCGRTSESAEPPDQTSLPLKTPVNSKNQENSSECLKIIDRIPTDEQHFPTNTHVASDTDSVTGKPQVKENVLLRMSSINSSGKQDNKAARILTAILLAFMVTATPYNVVVIVKSFDAVLVSDGVWFFCYFMFYVNSALDPVCYALANENFRKTYWKILKCSWKSGATNSFNSSVEMTSQNKNPRS